MAVMPSPCSVTFSRRLSIRDSRLICAPQSFSNVSHLLAPGKAPATCSFTNDILQTFHKNVKDVFLKFHTFFIHKICTKRLLNFMQHAHYALRRPVPPSGPFADRKRPACTGRAQAGLDCFQVRTFSRCRARTGARAGTAPDGRPAYQRSA